MDGVFALQAFSVPDIVITLAVVLAVLLIGRFLLKLAVKVVIIVALIAGVLWLLGSGSLFSLTAPLFALA